MYFIFTILIGFAAGILTGKLLNASGYGFVIDCMVALTGASLGGWVGLLSGFTPTERTGYYAAVLAGAVVTICSLRMFKARRSMKILFEFFLGLTCFLAFLIYLVLALKYPIPALVIISLVLATASFSALVTVMLLNHHNEGKRKKNV